MGLPAGVTIEPGQSEFVTQRGYFVKRYCNGKFFSCMLAAACTVLIRTGYKLPLTRLFSEVPPDNFVWQLHRAIDPTPTGGTTQAQTQLALQKLFGDTPPPVMFGGMSLEELVQAMLEGAAVRIMVDCGRLPDRLKRQVGTGYEGGHAWALTEAAIDPDGTITFRIIDPMFDPDEPYSGTWAAWSEFDQAVEKTAGGLIKVMIGYRNAAVPPPPPPEVEALSAIGQIVEEALS